MGKKLKLYKGKTHRNLRNEKDDESNGQSYLKYNSDIFDKCITVIRRFKNNRVNGIQVIIKEL